MFVCRVAPLHPLHSVSLASSPALSRRGRGLDARKRYFHCLAGQAVLRVSCAWSGGRRGLDARSGTSTAALDVRLGVTVMRGGLCRCPVDMVFYSSISLCHGDSFIYLSSFSFCFRFEEGARHLLTTIHVRLSSVVDVLDALCGTSVDGAGRVDLVASGPCRVRSFRFISSRSIWFCAHPLFSPLACALVSPSFLFFLTRSHTRRRTTP